MKLELENLTENHIKVGSVFFLYGNLKKILDVFCDFVVEKLKLSNDSDYIKVKSCSVMECSKIINNQCNLFDNKITIFLIKNLEDNHLEKISTLLQSFSKSIFILESGDYRKSKLITDDFLKSNKVYAIPAFKNDRTLISLCKLLLPKDTLISSEIINIINNTDEELKSLFTKISLLISSNNENLINDYVTYKNSFLQDVDFIPLTRYLMKLAVKEKIFDKKQSLAPINLSKKSMIEKLLFAEINQKIGTPLTKNVLYKF